MFWGSVCNVGCGSQRPLTPSKKVTLVSTKRQYVKGVRGR